MKVLTIGNICGIIYAQILAGVTEKEKVMWSQCKYLVSDDDNKLSCQLIDKFGYDELYQFYKDPKYCGGNPTYRTCFAANVADRLRLDSLNMCIHLEVKFETGWLGGYSVVGRCNRSGMTITRESSIRSCCTEPWFGTHACAGYEKQKSGPCFITTACVTSKGLPDDCDELETLRKYRDLLSEQDPALSKLFREYYVNAPKIVAKIDECENSASIYDELYCNLVTPCVAKLKAGLIDEAVKLYTDTYRDLLKKYSIVEAE